MKVNISPLEIVASSSAAPITRATNSRVRFVLSLWILIWAFLSERIREPRPAGTVLTLGSFSSSWLRNTRMSSSLSRGRNSVMERASIDLPVPGSPTMMTCRLCSAAFLTTIEAASWPIT